MARILVAEDDADIAALVRHYLEKDGFAVESLDSGRDVVARLAHTPADLVVLDLMLPGVDGLTLCRALRSHRATAALPIIMLTAKAAEADRIAGLELGADDYVTKPFGPEELLARIRVALRRVVGNDENLATGHFTAGDLIIDYDRRRVVRAGTEIRLTPKEFELLSLLARNHDRVLTHRAILKVIWGANAVEQPEHLWTLVAQLRKKLEPDPAKPRYLVSEPWVGYRFTTLP